MKHITRSVLAGLLVSVTWGSIFIAPSFAQKINPPVPVSQVDLPDIEKDKKEISRSDELYFSACENFFPFSAEQNFSAQDTKEKKICFNQHKKYFLLLRNRAWYAQNRDLKNLQDNIYNVKDTDDEMKHFSSSLYFAFAWSRMDNKANEIFAGQEEPILNKSIWEKNTRLLFSFEIFLPWSMFTQSNFYLNKNYFLLLESFHIQWEFNLPHRAHVFVNVGRFLKKGAAWQLEEEPFLFARRKFFTPQHGIEITSFFDSMSFAIVPFAIDAPLTSTLTESNSYFFAQDNAAVKKASLFKSDTLAYGASLRWAGKFDGQKKSLPADEDEAPTTKNNFTVLSAQMDYLRRGAVGDGAQKSDNGRLGNTADGDYLLHGQMDVQFIWGQKKMWQVWWFARLLASHGFDHTANFTIPLSGLSAAGGLAWQYMWQAKNKNTAAPEFVPRQQLTGNTNMQWMSPPAFTEAGYIRTAGYTSNEHVSYGGILLGELCSYLPHVVFDAEHTSYMKGEHCFRLPADFYLHQSLAWSIEEKSKNLNRPLWTLKLDGWLFSSLTRYAKTLPQKFSPMGGELNITLIREVKERNRISLSGGIFFPLEIAKKGSEHFASHLWRGGSDIFYGVKIQSDFMF